jgi:hypothetical protein
MLRRYDGGHLTIGFDITSRSAGGPSSSGWGAESLFQGQVNGATTLIVAGQPNPRQVARRAGTKLYDAHRRIRRGQRIAIVNGKQFQALLTRAST